MEEQMVETEIALCGAYKADRFPYDHTWHNRHHGKNTYSDIGCFSLGALLLLDRTDKYLGHLLGRAFHPFAWVGT